jgi:tRNA(fMet)-specific endonuclease VapC
VHRAPAVRGKQPRFTTLESHSRLAAVVREELVFGALRSRQQQKNLQQVQALLTAHRSLLFDDRAADACAKLRAELERAGQRIGYNDALIAATAIAYNLLLVTHNVGEFSRTPGLSLVDWEAP